MRAKVYGGCVAGLLCGPLAAECLVTCYAISATVLESEIAEYKRETEYFEKDFNKFADSFSMFATMADQSEKLAIKWYYKISDFKDVIEV